MSRTGLGDAMIVSDGLSKVDEAEMSVGADR